MVGGGGVGRGGGGSWDIGYKYNTMIKSDDVCKYWRYDYFFLDFVDFNIEKIIISFTINLN